MTHLLPTGRFSSRPYCVPGVGPLWTPFYCNCTLPSQVSHAFASISLPLLPFSAPSCESPSVPTQSCLEFAVPRAPLSQWLTCVEHERPAPLPWLGDKLRHNLCSRVSLWDQVEVTLRGALPEIAPWLAFFLFLSCFPPALCISPRGALYWIPWLWSLVSGSASGKPDPRQYYLIEFSRPFCEN